MIEMPLTKNVHELINAVKEHSVIYCPMIIVDYSYRNTVVYWEVKSFERFTEEMISQYSNRYALRGFDNQDFKILRDFDNQDSYKLSIVGDRFKLRKYYDENEYKLYKRKKIIKKVLNGN